RHRNGPLRLASDAPLPEGPDGLRRPQRRVSPPAPRLHHRHHSDQALPQGGLLLAPMVAPTPLRAPRSANKQARVGRLYRRHGSFYIVGRNPSPEVLSLSEDPGIIVTGAVDDTRPWVAGAEVYVVPMRMGGGVRLKVLQAMAMQCAIVSTPMGAEGIAVRP